MLSLPIPHVIVYILAFVGALAVLLAIIIVATVPFWSRSEQIKETRKEKADYARRAAFLKTDLYEQCN